MNNLNMSFAEPVSVFNPGAVAWSLVQETDSVLEITPARNRSLVTYEELELIESLRQGEEAAFTTLVERYHGRLLRFAQSFVSNHAVAEEVVQETWIAVLEGIHRFEGRSSLKTWLFRILQNIAKTKGKREHRYVSFIDAEDAPGQEKTSAMEPERLPTSKSVTGGQAIPSTTGDDHTPERLLVSKQSLAQIEQAIQALPSDQRKVIVLRDIEGVESEEVCQILHITPTNQRVLLHRARTKVRQALYPYLQGRSPATSAALN